MKKTDLNSNLSGHWRRRHETGGAGEALSDDAAAPGRPDLRKVFGGRENFAFGRRHVLLAARHHKDRLLAAHRRLDVRVRLGSQRFNLTTYKSNQIKSKFIQFIVDLLNTV